MPRLELWSMNIDSIDEAPVLKGEVFGHPKKKDGTNVITSTLITLDLDKGIGITLNTTYELGLPDPEWVLFLIKTQSTSLTKVEKLRDLWLSQTLPNNGPVV